MRKTALLMAVLAACATGPQAKDEGPAARPGAQFDADRDIATTLRSINIRSLKGEAAAVREEFMEQARARPNDWKPKLFAAWAGQPSEESWQEVARVAKFSPDEPWPWAASGLIYLKWKGFLDQADGEFQKALKVKPGFLPALVGRADVLRLRASLKEAKAAYEAVLAQAPDWQEALVGLGLTQVGLSDSAAASATLDRALKVDGDNLEAVNARAKLAVEAKDMPRGIELNGKLLQFNPRDRDAHLALAKMKADAGDEAGAATSYEAAMAIAPDLATAKALESVAHLDKKETAPYLRIAEIHKADGDSEGAEAAMRQAAERAPDDAAIHLALARLIGEHEDLVASIEAFRSALKKGAADAEADLKVLETKAGLGKQIVGDANKVYGEVFGRLNARFQQLQKTNPTLGGKMRARVTVGSEGIASQVEVLEDTVHEASLTALVYFSLKDAKYAKKGTPAFEFELKPAKKK